MKGKILFLGYSTKQHLPLKNNEFLNLRNLENYCLSHGLTAKNAKSCLVVRIDNVSFQVFKNGKIGLCNLKSLADIEDLDNRLIDYFWRNFASFNVEREVLCNGKNSRKKAQ